MGWILAKLAGPLVAPILAGVLLASVSGLGLTWWHLHEANGTIDTLTADKAALTTDLATSRLETAQTAKAMSDFHAQVEMDRADANTKTLADQKRMQGQIDGLAAKVATTERARRAASDDLLKVLHAIPKEQQATISPAVRDALRRVRDAQGVTDAPASTAPGGGQNDNRISAAPVSRGADMPP